MTGKPYQSAVVDDATVRRWGVGDITALAVAGGAVFDGLVTPTRDNSRPKRGRRRRSSEDLKREIAYHEAGHAVAAWLFGLTINHVTIIRDGDDLGSCWTYDPAYRDAVMSGMGTPAQVIAVCVRRLAGHYADYRLFRNHRQWLDSNFAVFYGDTDWSEVHEITGLYPRSDDYWGNSIDWTEKTLSRVRPLVEQVAESLLQRGKMWGNEVSDMLHLVWPVTPFTKEVHSAWNDGSNS